MCVMGSAVELCCCYFATVCYRYHLKKYILYIAFLCSDTRALNQDPLFYVSYFTMIIFFSSNNYSSEDKLVKYNYYHGIPTRLGQTFTVRYIIIVSTLIRSVLSVLHIAFIQATDLCL